MVTINRISAVTEIDRTVDHRTGSQVDHVMTIIFQVNSPTTGTGYCCVGIDSCG